MKSASCPTNLRVCVVGAGLMGADHIERLTHRIFGAEVSAVVDADASRAKKAVEAIPTAVALSNVGQALDREDVNAVLIATPGFLHRDMLLQVRERDLPILCEKPLTPDAQSSWEVLEAEQRLGKKRIQVGFMRRFDTEYQRLRAIIKGVNDDAGRQTLIDRKIDVESDSQGKRPNTLCTAARSTSPGSTSSSQGTDRACSSRHRASPSRRWQKADPAMA
jgi:predicted dehydrogenase